MELLWVFVGRGEENDSFKHFISDEPQPESVSLKKWVMVRGGLLRPEWKRRLMMAISIHNVMLSVLLWWKCILLENKVWYDYLQQALWWSLWSPLSLKSFWKENEYFLFTKKVLKLLNWSKVTVDSKKLYFKYMLLVMIFTFYWSTNHEKCISIFKNILSNCHYTDYNKCFLSNKSAF